MQRDHFLQPYTALDTLLTILLTLAATITGIIVLYVGCASLKTSIFSGGNLLKHKKEQWSAQTFCVLKLRSSKQQVFIVTHNTHGCTNKPITLRAIKEVTITDHCIINTDKQAIQ